MKKLALVGAILIAAPLSAQANLLFTVGAKASVWDAEPTGQIDDNVSVEKGGLNLKSENGTQITVFFEHPVPFIPNVKLKSTDLDIKGSGVLNANINFAGKPFAVSEAVDSNINLSHTDATLYWGLPIPLPYINVDFGLTARMFDGDASVTQVSDTTRTESVDLDMTLPMAYGAVKVGSPFGIYATADVNWIGFGDNKMTDLSAAVGYELPIPIVDVGVEVGYRGINLQTDRKDVDVAADLDTKGMFYGVSVAFGF